MARSSTDLPRMQIQARAAGRAFDAARILCRKPAEPAAQAAASRDDAAIRAGRAGPALQSEDRRGSAQPRLCLRHEGAWRADARLGRPLFLPSARSRRHPHRPQARRRHHRRGAAARHHRGHRRDPRRDRPAVRPRHRRPGRGPDQAQEARPRHQGGQAGGKPAQAPARHRRRRARAAGQARRPAAQHAHARASCRPEARRRIAEETLDIYAPLAGRMGMHEMREELEDLAFRELNPEAYGSSPSGSRRSRRATAS